MAKWNVQKDVGMENYSDGDVENIIYRYVENETDIKELPVKDLNYPIIYHLSEMRENILNWYPFKKNAVILEMGAGCGAITGCLCERAQRVVSMDISERRSRINYIRHKDYDNLEIVVGNINRMKFEEQFDYIVINGVLEYAAMFTEGTTPYETCIKGLKKYLKPDGKFLIAIENKLGIKYFAGSPEDHTNEYFGGLSGYKNAQVRTFGKKELEELLQKCGFRYSRFYYPYPDYKFPEEIFTMASIDKYGTRTLTYLQENHFQLFDVKNVCESLKKENIMEIFANSFLVEAGMIEEPWKEEILYVKTNQDRAEEFRICTTIKRNAQGRKIVEKRALHKNALSHIQKMATAGEYQRGRFETISGLYNENRGSICYPYIEGQNLEDEIREIMKRKEYTEEEKKVRLLYILDDFVDSCRKEAVKTKEFFTGKFQKVFGEAPLEEDCDCLCPANIDMIFNNVFWTEDHYLVIDPEWVFDFPIPVDFILWRAFNELLENIKELEELLSREFLLKRYGMYDGEKETVFRAWANHFVDYYVKANRTRKWCKPVLPFDFYRTAEEILCQKTVVELYYSNGEGFDEERKFVYEANIRSGKFQTEFLLKDVDATVFRLDPAIYACQCRLNRVWIDKGKAKVKINDITKISPVIEMESKEWYEFQSDDPQYLIELTDPSAERLYIEGEIILKY